MTGPDTLSAFRALGEAAAIGLLVGIERYRDPGSGNRRSAGVRTFTVTALLGAACGLLAEPLLTAATFLAVAGLFGVGYWRRSTQHLGLTTEFGGLLVFWLGYLVHDYELPAVSAGIVLTIVLALKRELHAFVLESVSEREFYDTLKFLAVVFVVYPVLPDRDLGPWGFFNPTQVWALVMLVSALSYCGYLAMRFLGTGRGLQWSAVVGGIVSTTAVTMSLAQRARQSPEHERLCGTVAVMANAVQFPRLLALVWTLSTPLAVRLAPALLAMGLIGWAGAWLLGRRSLRAAPEMDMGVMNPFRLRPALQFGLFFVGIFLLVNAAEAWLGAEGVVVASLIAGTGDASAITLSAAAKVSEGSLAPELAVWAVFAAVTTNALVKIGLAWGSGTRATALWLAGGLATMLAAGVVIILLPV